MAQFYDHITDEIKDFIRKQPLFFVATAPLNADGHVNLSPKGMDSFRILGDNSVGYIDMTGSGNETSAHIAENGRITFMFCGFENKADIIRLYGTGRVVLPDAPEWDTLSGHFPALISARQLIIADVHKAQSSCGYAVPYMEFKGERDTLSKYWQVKGEDALPEYWENKNVTSIDGLTTPLGDALQNADD